MSSVIGPEARWYVCDIIKKYEENTVNGFHGDSLVCVEYVEQNTTAMLKKHAFVTHKVA